VSPREFAVFESRPCSLEDASCEHRRPEGSSVADASSWIPITAYTYDNSHKQATSAVNVEAEEPANFGPQVLDQV